MLLVALAPYALSLGFVRSKIESTAKGSLNGDLHIGSLSWSWTQGVSAADIRIDNPDGFPTERPAVQMKSMIADVSLSTLLGATPSATAKIVGMEIFVEQNADGSTNLQALAKQKNSEGANEEKQGEEGAETPETEPQSEPRSIAFDVVLQDCAVHVRRDGKLVEDMTGLNVRAHSTADSADVLIDVVAKLLAGDLDLDAKVDPNTQEAEANLVTHGLDLSTWRPLVDAFMPNKITALTGKVDGDIHVMARGSDSIELGGTLTVLGPRIAGPLLKGMDVRSERWTVAPVLGLGDVGKQVDASKFAVDLEWLQIRGKSAAAGAVALGYELDLAKLAEFGGPMPAMLKNSGSKLTGELQVPTTDLPADAAGWAKAVGTTASLQIAALDVGGFSLRQLALDATMADGKLAVKTSPTSMLDGAPLLLQANVGLDEFDRMPTTASLKWNGGDLTGGATKALRYAMPLFAGLDAEVAKVVGKVDLDLSFDGPAMKLEGQTWANWLNSWSGSGALGLLDTAFAPSTELQGLLAPLGPLSNGTVPVATNGRLKIDSFRAPFAFAKGVVEAKATEWMAAGQKIGLSGNIGFDGKVDYAVDLSSLLKGHKDGERVLKALGGSLPAARLNGTVDSPALGLPRLENIATKLLQQEGKNLLEKGLKEGLQNGLNGLFGGKKKK
ncbi:MAG: hypothetical protein AB8H80_09075 [Planctomycetota bacterium]